MRSFPHSLLSSRISRETCEASERLSELFSHHLTGEIKNKSRDENFNVKSILLREHREKSHQNDEVENRKKLRAVVPTKPNRDFAFCCFLFLGRAISILDHFTVCFPLALVPRSSARSLAFTKCAPRFVEKCLFNCRFGCKTLGIVHRLPHECAHSVRCSF